MPDVTPSSKTEGDRILVLECAVADLQADKQARITEGQWLWGTIIALAGVVALLVVSYVH